MKISLADATDAIRNLRAFRTTTDTLRAETLWVLSGVPETGKLPGPYASALRDAQSKRKERYMAGEGRGAVPEAPMYIVFSYGTPIAWLTIAGDVVIPDVTYSPTMTRHQRMARIGLTTAGETYVRALQESNEQNPNPS